MTKSSGTVLHHNYFQLLFVFVAFALMALAAYLFIGRILRSRLLNGAQELLSSAEANVKAGLSESETTLLNSCYVVQGMVEQDDPRQDILDYLTFTTEWMRQRDTGLLDFFGIYGYINGEFYDSIGMNPDDDFIPQRQPWYQTAVRSINAVAYTAPYVDWASGDTIVSAVRNIETVSGGIAGIVSVDISINWLVEYVSSLALADDGYGILLSQNLTLMAYPDKKYLGSQFQELGGAYEDIARSLRNKEDVFARRIKDLEGVSAIVFFKPLFNGWYVGIVTPYSQFYHDLNTSAQILALLGLVLSLSLCFILLRLSSAKMRADEESRSKSSFLANMSHEIRTPMNAITGMAELLLRGELSDEARGYAQDIKQAGNNLISIINDILDFSKIEAGKLDIVPAKYMLSSLINDTINIIRMRLEEKPIRFFTNIDGSIPNNLIGDVVRLRQILLNLLSNAVKYSEKGYIGLFIIVEKRDATQVWLRITVEDTGRGIKPEDQEKLFSEFTQVDALKNRGIEGTGLGLAITKRLCNAMGGDIAVKSEYGFGSTFTATILQGVDSDVPFAFIAEPGQKKVLVYEGRPIYAKSVCWTLENLLIPHSLVATHEDFVAALNREEWTSVFAGYSLYSEINQLMEKPDADFCGGKKPSLALIVKWGTETYIPNVRFLFLPISSLSVANIINGKADGKIGGEVAALAGVVRFTFNNVRFLVVDDIATNLKVAEGLLAPYKAAVDTCLSGAEAVDLVKQTDYDIVFMDHMMPGIDGIEATSLIRAWEQEQQDNNPGYSGRQIPIIALTANAVMGMREMFIEEGFNDFLAKPIEVAKLDDILDRWIPEEKKEIGSWELGVGNREEKNSLPTVNDSYPALPDSTPLPTPHSLFIPGLDIKKGIAMTGGTVELYREVLDLYCKDAEERLPFLKTFQGIKEGDAAELHSFTTQVHALKSASASIGASEVSAEAAGLEAAGRSGYMAFIEENLGSFTDKLTELIGNIQTALEEGKNEKLKIKNEEIINEELINEELINEENLGLLFSSLKTALKSQNTLDIDRILEELGQNKLDPKTREALEKISDHVLMAEYESASEVVGSLLDTGG